MTTHPFNPYATAEEIAGYLGTSNWVLAKRTSRTVAKYGEDVVCLSPERFKEMERVILLKRTEGYD